jgi:hypothetical protein
MYTGTKLSVEQTRVEINRALKALSEATGLDFSIGAIRYSADLVKTSLVGVRRGVTGKTDTAVDMKELQLAKVGKSRLGPCFDMKKRYISDTLGIVAFVGYNSRAPKFPFIVQCENGKRFKVSETSAKRMMDKIA